MIDRAYAGCLAFADWCERRRLSLLVIGAPVYLLIVVGVGELVLQRFPNSGDEYAYLYQAATLAEGRLSNPAPPLPDAFAFNYITRRGDRVFSAFPPGWPLALTLAGVLRVPAWLVNPICGVLSLLLVWALASELHGDRIGPLATALVASSGFFIFNAASYFSHTFCGLLLLLAACSAAAAGRRRAVGPLLTGFFIGWAVLARYFTGSLCGIAIGALLVSRTRPHHLRALALVVAGGAPWLLFLLAYNAALSGTPWRLTTLDMTVSIWFARGFATRGLDILATQLLQFLLWTPPALLLAYLWFLRRATRSHGIQLLDWLFVATALTLVFYVNRGGNQYGPRFYYEAFLFLVVFTAGHLFRADDLARRGSRNAARVCRGGVERGSDAAPARVACRTAARHHQRADGRVRPGRGRAAHGCDCAAGGTRRNGAIDGRSRSDAQRNRVLAHCALCARSNATGELRARGRLPAPFDVPVCLGSHRSPREPDRDPPDSVLGQSRRCAVRAVPATAASSSFAGPTEQRCVRKRAGPTSRADIGPPRRGLPPATESPGCTSDLRPSRNLVCNPLVSGQP